ncbi:MAG: DUF3891 family protein [Rubrobacteraceae bacterium]
MIVRKLEDSFLLVRQHDHGKISGEFGRHWGEEIAPLEPTLFAIANHDLGWQELDDEVRFNPDTGEPYSFIDYPLEPKLAAYEHGLDQAEAREPYAAYLCSRHYSSFVQNSEEPAAVDFRNKEAERRRLIENRVPREWLANAEYNFRLLQLCDDFSLFVCLNEPGENTFPWYRDGFDLPGRKFQPVWQNKRTLNLVPNPFSEPFEFEVPYSRLRPDGGMEAGGFRIRVVC